MDIRDSIEINAPTDKVFGWLTNIRTGKEYRAWHPDHVNCRWVKGEPFQQGSVALFEEYLHGRLHRLRFKCTRVIPNRLIDYKPSFPISIIMSGGRFATESAGTRKSIFTAVISFRGNLLLKRLFAGEIESIRQHMKEEGENIKRIVEGLPPGAHG